VNVVLHLEAEISLVRRCQWRQSECVYSDVYEGLDHVGVEMHIDPMIEQVWRCT
jgi:hypothetical protein